MGPTNIKLIELFRARIKSIVEENPEIRINQIPVDLITASGSGLDPHISPEAAQLQAARIAKIRRLSVDQVQALIKEKTEGPQWGLFGEPTINVLELNLTLDEVSL